MCAGTPEDMSGANETDMFAQRAKQQAFKPQAICNA